MSEGRGRLMSQLSKKKRIRPSSTFLFFLDPHRLDDAPLR